LNFVNAFPGFCGYILAPHPYHYACGIGTNLENEMTTKSNENSVKPSVAVESVGNANLQLWERVRTPDPAYTKVFNRGGGFSGTSINATYQTRCATAEFGPIGIGWGVDILEERFVEGAPIIIEGKVICREVIHVLKVELWYKLNGQTGKLVQFGQTTFVGKNKYGPFTDEEAPKKSLTDATTKCLSLLGFAADVFVGLFDDNKYVNDAREAYDRRAAAEITETGPDASSSERTVKSSEQQVDPEAPISAEMQKLLDEKSASVNKTVDIERLKTARTMAPTLFTHPKALTTFVEVCDARIAELEKMKHEQQTEAPAEEPVQA